MSGCILHEDDKDKQQYPPPADIDAEFDQHNVDVERILARTQMSFGTRSRFRRIPLYEAPEFIKRLNAFEEVTAGETVAFSCQWKALPKPTVKWYKDDEEITEDTRYTLQTDDPEPGILRLVIKSAKKNDEGAYKCKAENQEGVASTTGYLSVSGGSDEETLASKAKKDQKQQARKTPDHVSSAPFLRTIVEQYSVEELEALSIRDQPPSPIQDFIDQAQVDRLKGVTWPLLGYKHRHKDDDAMSSGSETSVESQDCDRVQFSADIDDDDVFTDQIPNRELQLLNGSTQNAVRAQIFSNGDVIQNGATNERTTPDIRVTPAGTPHKRGAKSKHGEHARRTPSGKHRLPSLYIGEMFGILDSQWIYFLPIASSLTFYASATEMNPLLMVFLIMIIAFVLFHFLFTRDKQDKT